MTSNNRDDPASTMNYAGGVHAAGQSSVHIGNNNYWQLPSNTPSRVDERNVPHWIVPFRRNKDFVGRESALSRLLEMIPPSADGDGCQHTAIEGLGGIGKTQIALEAAFRLRERHQDCSVFWVPALDVTSFENAYRNIGRELKIQGIDVDQADTKSLVKTALSQSSRAWLLIIDNADDKDLFFGNAEAPSLFDYLPLGPQGSILFTTRTHAVVSKLDIPPANVLRVSGIERSEAKELLQKTLNSEQTSDVESTLELLDFLSDLPLAIKQASAYMNQQDITTRQYLSYCRSSDARFIELLSKHFEDRGRYKNKHAQNPVATTWMISFDKIFRDDALAAQYLQFMSILSEKDIPVTLLPPGKTELEAWEAIGTLKSYAFITKRPDQDSYDMHRLVRLVMRNWMVEKNCLEISVTAVIQRLVEVFPDPEHDNRAIWLRYLPHALAWLELRDYSMDKAVEPRLVWKVGDCAYALGNYQTAEELYQQAVGLVTKVFGADNLNTLRSKHRLANAVYKRGKYKQAELLYRELVELQTKILGAEHPDTLRSQNGLADAISTREKYTQAEMLYREVLILRTKVLGPEHPDTLSSQVSLAAVLNNQGMDLQAEMIYQEVLKLQEKTLGADHPDTLWSQNGLANAISNQGKYIQGEMLYREVLMQRTKLLGPEHPDTLIVQDSLARALENQGKYVQAEIIYREVLKLRTKILGPENPQTLRTHDNLARVLNSQGKHMQAEILYRDVLKLRERILGADHPDTLWSQNGLAIAISDQGKYIQAETLFREVLELRVKILGADHLGTLISQDFLAGVLCEQEKFIQAEMLFRELSELRTKVQGPEHPDTLRIKRSHELVLSKLSRSRAS